MLVSQTRPVLLSLGSLAQTRHGPCTGQHSFAAILPQPLAHPYLLKVCAPTPAPTLTL